MIELILGIIGIYLIIVVLGYIWQFIVFIFPYVAGLTGIFLGGYLFVLMVPVLIKIIAFIFKSIGNILLWILTIVKFFFIVIMNLIKIMFILLISLFKFLLHWLWVILFLSVPLFQMTTYHLNHELLAIIPIVIIVIGLVSVGLKKPVTKQA